MPYNPVLKLGLFQDECKFWVKLPDTEQTWVKNQDILAEDALDLRISCKMQARRDMTTMQPRSTSVNKTWERALRILRQKSRQTDRPFPTLAI